jgi:hypothetical protein
MSETGSGRVIEEGGVHRLAHRLVCLKENEMLLTPTTFAPGHARLIAWTASM